MKNLFLGLIAMVMFSVSGYAKKTNNVIFDNVIKIENAYNDKTVTLKKTVSNVTEANLSGDSRIEKIISVLNVDLTCRVTIWWHDSHGSYSNTWTFTVESSSECNDKKKELIAVI